MFCKNCGKQIDDNAAVCVHCGVSTGGGPVSGGQGTVYCRNCGKPLNANAAVCTNCGASTGSSSSVRGPVNDEINPGFVVLSLFVWLFGIIYGAIKMNDGYKRSGQVYLWCGIGMGILSLIGGIWIIW